MTSDGLPSDTAARLTLGTLAASIPPPPLMRYRGTRLRDVAECLRAHAGAPAIIGVEDGAARIVVSRTTVERLFAVRFGSELFGRRSIHEGRGAWIPVPLVLDRSLAVSDAVSQALERPDALRNEPIIIIDTAGRPVAIDMRVLLGTQCRHLDLMLDELNERRRAAEVAAEAKTQFLAQMSHELRTPLNSVIGYAEILTHDDGLSADEQHDAHDTILRQSHKLLAMIEDLLDLTSDPSESDVAGQTACDIRRIVDDLTDAARHHADASGIELIVEHDADLPESITTDGDRLSRAVRHLLQNAISYTEEGFVSVRSRLAHVTGDAIIIDVVDSGPGLSESEIDRALRPFEQLDASMSRRHAGAGIGLPIASQLVTTLGGTLEIESLPGVGSRFSIVLPRRSVMAPKRRAA